MGENQKALRKKVLQRLYQARLKRPNSGYLFLRELDQAIGECEFALAVLVEIGHVKCKGIEYQITGKGVIAFEEIEEG